MTLSKPLGRPPETDVIQVYVNGCAPPHSIMNIFKVWVCRMDGASSLRVVDLENTEWLLRRLSDFFVFKTCEPLRGPSSSSQYTFRVAYNSQLSASSFERVLAGISEVEMIVESLESYPTTA